MNFSEIKNKHESKLEDILIEYIDSAIFYSININTLKPNFLIDIKLRTDILKNSQLDDEFTKLRLLRKIKKDIPKLLSKHKYVVLAIHIQSYDNLFKIVIRNTFY